MSHDVLLGLIGLVGNGIVATAFTLMGRAHAKERKFLINAALSGNTYEFAVRQAASADPKPAEFDDLTTIQYPEGL